MNRFRLHLEIIALMEAENKIAFSKKEVQKIKKLFFHMLLNAIEKLSTKRKKKFLIVQSELNAVSFVSLNRAI